MDRGYIRLFRKFFDSKIWKTKRVYSFAEAWIDLIRMARWKDEPQKMFDDRGEYVLERGDVYASLRFLGERWRWSTTKVNRFLSILVKDESILIKIRNSQRTILHIKKLGTYLEWGNTENDAGVTQRKRRSNAGVTKKKPVKKEEPDKPNKYIYGEFKNVKLSLEEEKKLIERFGKEDTKEKIENLSLYLSSKGDKYKSHYATILSWTKRDEKENNGRRDVGQNSAGGVRPAKGKYDHLVTK